MSLSKGLRRLFEVEIDNEHIEETGCSRSGNSYPGGANPATLESCLDSLEQGLDIGFDSQKLIKELKSLIRKHGEDTEVLDLL